MPGWCDLTNSLARANPLIGLTAEKYRDFACALVSYVALNATVDQTIYFTNLYRAPTRPEAFGNHLRRRARCICSQAGWLIAA